MANWYYRSEKIEIRMMMRILLPILFLFVFALPLFGEGIIVKTNPKTYHVKVAVEFEISGAIPNVLTLALPIPETNEYQDIKLIWASHGRIFNYLENDQRFLFCWFARNEIPSIVFHEFEVTMYDIAVDFSKIDKIYPYDTSNLQYRRYTSKSGIIIDPHHPKIKRIAKEIGKDITSPIVFAQRAYEYIGANYKYGVIGIENSLDKALRLGKGDCGQMSAIFISLLRNQGIPARHIVAVRPSYGDIKSENHVWAEFYLENYGWIPVDATAHMGDKKRHFFGDKKAFGVIFSRDCNVSIPDMRNDTRKIDYPQQYFWDQIGMTRGNVERRYFIESKLLESEPID